MCFSNEGTIIKKSSEGSRLQLWQRTSGRQCHLFSSGGPDVSLETNHKRPNVHGAGPAGRKCHRLRSVLQTQVEGWAARRHPRRQTTIPQEPEATRTSCHSDLQTRSIQWQNGLIDVFQVNFFCNSWRQTEMQKLISNHELQPRSGQLDSVWAVCYFNESMNAASPETDLLLVKHRVSGWHQQEATSSQVNSQRYLGGRCTMPESCPGSGFCGGLYPGGSGLSHSSPGETHKTPWTTGSGTHRTDPAGPSPGPHTEEVRGRAREGEAGIGQ